MMTDNEIIKALKCCQKPVGSGVCNDCPLKSVREKRLSPNDKSCTTIMLEDALDLIASQKAEKEALIAGQETLQKHIAEQRAEIERLEKENKNLLSKLCKKVRTESKVVEKLIKAEAIKEFAERLKDKSKKRTQDVYGEMVFFGDIDNLVKEMVGEE